MSENVAKESQPLTSLVVGDDALVTLDEYARLFGGHPRAHQRRAQSGCWKDARKMAGRWYVIVKADALRARVTAHGVFESKK